MELWPFGSMWWSHELNGPGVCYKTVAHMIVIVNGPYPCGNWADLCVTRNVLHRGLEEGEFNIAGCRYRESAYCSAMMPVVSNDF